VINLEILKRFATEKIFVVKKIIVVIILVFKFFIFRMHFQKPTLDIIVENLEKIFSDIDKVYWSKKIVESILKWDIYVGWVITFDSFFSNVIKFWTQSLYSHVTFCYPDNDGICYVWWAENSKWLTIQKYDNSEDSLFVIKKLDLDRILDNVDFKQFSIVLDEIYWKNSFSRALQRFHIFKNEVKKLNKINFYTLLEVEAEIEKQIKQNDLELQIKKELSKLKEVLWYEKWIITHKENVFSDDDKFYKKLFFCWWVVKFLLANYGKKYDYLSIFTMYLIKPFIIKYDYLAKWTKRFFCSEFVSATFLYAGFYPFDFYGKYPDLVVPGDLMDPNLWIYDERFLKVIRYFKNKNIKPLVLDWVNNKKQVYELIQWMRINKFLKTSFHIIALYLLLWLIFSIPWVIIFLLFRF